MARKGGTQRNGESILCPCFKGVTANEIWCESHVPESSVTVLRYGSKEARRKQVKLYCECNWKRCEHYLAVKHMRWEDPD